MLFIYKNNGYICLALVYIVLLFIIAVNILVPFGIKLYRSIVFCILVTYFWLLVSFVNLTLRDFFLFGIRRVSQIFFCQSGMHVVLVLPLAHRIKLVSLTV